MNRDDAKERIDAGVEALHEALAAGKSEQLEQYLAVMGKFRQYSWGNQMLIYHQAPEATHVAGYTAWKQLGRQVKKGQHGIGILAPIRRKVKDDDGDDKVAVFGFKLAFVFDLTQTEGEELPEFAKASGDPRDYQARIEEVIRQAGIHLVEDDLPLSANGCSEGGIITIRPGLEPAERLRVADSDDLIRPDDFNCFDYLKRRYTYLRTFFPRFLRVIELEGTPAAEPILSAVRALKYWNAEAIRKVPASAPLDFVPAKWKPYVCASDGTVDRHYYELCVLNQLHQALQSAEVWAVGGRRYGNTEDLLIPREEWEDVRDQCYQELELPKDPQVWLDKALGKLTAQIGKTTRNLSSNPQVFIEGDKVHLKSLDPIELPQRVTRLKQRVAESWPQIRIQDLLVEVDSWTNYTKYFRSLRGRRSSMQEFCKALYASLIAKGCNIGMTKMASLAPGIGARTFQRINEIYLHDDTLQRVIEQLGGAVHALPIAGLMGDETVSMSDGMRIRTRVRAMNAAFMPEHFPRGQRAITYYWHISHQGPGYGAQVFGNDRDAAYVLDQILHIRSELPIKEHYTDTHGATETTLALADAFGIDFCTRIKAVFKQQLYHPPGMKVPGPLKKHFARAVDIELIKRYWDDYVRILASIRRGHTSVVLLSQRLSSYAAANPLYKVIREIGRIVKTRHILRTYGEPEFRRRVNAGLDRIENFNYLARHIFFARRGENWEREFEEQLNRASSLMIVANACVLWNAVHLSELVKQLKEEGFEFEADDLSHVSLYAFEHIIQYGQYFFNLKLRDRKDALSNAQNL